MTTQGQYTYSRGTDGCDNTFDIYDPAGELLTSIRYWEREAGAEADARLIVNALNTTRAIRASGVTRYTLVENDLEGTHLVDADGKIAATVCMATPEALRLMKAGPTLLEAAKRTVRQFELILEMDDPQACTQMDWEAEPLASLRQAVAEAEGGE